MTPELEQLARRLELDEHFRAAVSAGEISSAARLAIAIAAPLIRSDAFRLAGRTAALAWSDPARVVNEREQALQVAQRILELDTF